MNLESVLDSMIEQANSLGKKSAAIVERMDASKEDREKMKQYKETIAMYKQHLRAGNARAITMYEGVLKSYNNEGIGSSVDWKGGRSDSNDANKQ